MICAATDNECLLQINDNYCVACGHEYDNLDVEE